MSTDHLVPTGHLAMHESHHLSLSKKDRRKVVLLRMSIPIVLLVCWELCFRIGVVSPTTFSAPSLILVKFYRLLQSGEILVHSWNSVSLIIAALALSCIVAVPLGLLMGARDIFFNLFDPVVELLRPIPPLALLPLAIVWLGIGIAEKLFVLFIGTFPPIVMNTVHGVRSADRVLIKAARSMAASDADILSKVLIPHALPSILVGVRIASGFAFTVIVAAELVATRNGLGYLLTIGWRTYDLETIFVSIAMIGIWAYLIDLSIRAVTKKAVRWRTDHSSPLELRER